MEKKVYQLEAVSGGDPQCDIVDFEQARSNVLQATRNFKNSWRNLAQALEVVWRNKLYTKWGYSDFDQYATQEVRIRKHTALKLIRSHMFLEKERPEYIERAGDEERPAPTFEMVNMLQRAKKVLGSDEYARVKSDLWRGEKPEGEVKKDLVALIGERRKTIDPEQERTRRGKVAVKQFLSILKNFRQEVETLKILPGDIADDITALIDKINSHIVQDAP